MGGISSSVGPFSGINTQSLIEQLLAVEARPIALAQNRLGQLQLQQTAILDLNSRLASLRDASAAFRTKKSFDLTKATSGDEKVLTGKASTSAQPGSYQFIVDRLVSTQQMLSRGFADRSSSGLNAGTFSFESEQARLDRDMSLADLNGGEGVARGKIVISDGSGSATIDLSKAATVSEVIEAINANGTVNVKASTQDGKLVLKHGTGGSFTVSNATGYTTATSLGIAGSSSGGKITGSNLYYLSRGSSLSSLNDGNGVPIKNSAGTGAFNFTITVSSTGNPDKAVKVNLGDVYETVEGKLTLKESAVSTVGGVLDRINSALAAEGVTGVTAKISSTGSRLELSVNPGAATDIRIADNPNQTGSAKALGLTGIGNGNYAGERILAGLNTTLLANLNGGNGVSGVADIDFTARDGTTFTANINTGGTVEEMIAEIESKSGIGANGKPRISVSVDPKGTGLKITDNTGSTTSRLIIQGIDGSDAAASLGISTGPTGVDADTVSSGNLQHAYVTGATALSSLNGGKGVGTGKFRITDSFGGTMVVDIGTDSKTMQDVIDEINSQASGQVKIKAKINDTGDGIEIEEFTNGGPAGTLKIKIADESGKVASALQIAGEAKGTGSQNTISGSMERTIEFSPTDTLEGVMKKINDAGVGMTATIIKDGSGSAPYRLSLTSTTAGRAGRMLVDTGNLDLSFSTMDKGEDSRVFFGSSDPATAVLLSSSTNTLDGVIQGVTIDLKSRSDEAVALTVTSDTEGIEADVQSFIKSFNDLVSRISTQQSYNSETKAKGPLLGDGSTNALRVALFNTLQSPAKNISGRYNRLAQVGVEVGTGGKLELNTDKFRAALAEDPASVEALFAARVQDENSGKIDLGDGITATDPNASATFSSLGVIGQIEELAKRYLDPANGLWTAKKKATDNVIATQNKRITDMNTRLDNRRLVLQNQFTRMEKAIAQLQQQQTALSSLG
ncbi:MAG TPA: flagellar filament capping protein FliD [Phycisphaerales bacterium]|nr:flagellar filament capping protein FliD [Phycisphaerales bacterium]